MEQITHLYMEWRNVLNEELESNQIANHVESSNLLSLTNEDNSEIGRSLNNELPLDNIINITIKPEIPTEAIGQQQEDASYLKSSTSEVINNTSNERVSEVNNGGIEFEGVLDENVYLNNLENNHTSSNILTDFGLGPELIDELKKLKEKFEKQYAKDLFEDPFSSTNSSLSLRNLQPSTSILPASLISPSRINWCTFSNNSLLLENESVINGFLSLCSYDASTNGIMDSQNERNKVENVNMLNNLSCILMNEDPNLLLPDLLFMLNMIPHLKELTESNKNKAKLEFVKTLSKYS